MCWAQSKPTSISNSDLLDSELDGAEKRLFRTGCDEFSLGLASKKGPGIAAMVGKGNLLGGFVSFSSAEALTSFGASAIVVTLA